MKILSKKITIRQIVAIGFVVVLLLLAKPLPTLFWIGFTLSFMGELLRLWACGYLHKNAELAVSGPYAHLKHPLYMGTFLGFLGLLIAVSGPNPPGIYLCLIGIPFFLLVFFTYYLPKKNKTEKERMLKYFGEDFIRWDSEVPDFIPRLKPYSSGKKQKFDWRGILRNSESSMFLVFWAGWGFLFLKLHKIL